MGEVRMEIELEPEPVLLEPFSHQVGGHSSILCLDERTICKPLIKQEVKFYETLPTSMKKFTPEYGGIVQVRFEEDSHGYSAVATRPAKLARSSSHPVPNSRKHGKTHNRSDRHRKRPKGSLESESELNDMYESEEKINNGTDTPTHNNERRRSSGSSGSHNPWALKCHNEHISKLRNRSAAIVEKETPAQTFVLLENLTWRFEYPCILDLKMGTRQYGDDATPAKIESQIAKAASSTSVQLGVRICGMQVYQTTSGKFVYRNKYYGRKLGVDGFKEGLCDFLHNGNRLRKDALIPLIEKLEELKTAMSTLDTFRFYTSSLLLIYEGLDPEYIEEEDDEEENAAHAHAHTSQPSACLSSLAMGLDEESTNGQMDGHSTQPIENGSAAELAGNDSKMHSSLSSESVDVRLIDFAHATHSGLDLDHCAIKHAGPDAGFIFGLSNLISTLKEIVEGGNYSRVGASG